MRMMLSLFPALLTLLLTGAAGNHTISIPEAGITFQVPAAWRAGKREASPSMGNIDPPFPRGGTFNFEGAPSNVAYMVYDPRLQAAQRAKYSELPRAARRRLGGKPVKVLRSGKLDGMDVVEFEGGMTDPQHRATLLHGAVFSRGLVECEVTVLLRRRPANRIAAEWKALRPGFDLLVKTFRIAQPAENRGH